MLKFLLLDPKMESSSLLYQPVTKVGAVVIPGLKEINLKGAVDEVVDEKMKSVEEDTLGS